MTKPIPLPGPAELFEVNEATWPAASRQHLGAWIIREGQGGGKRVSAATEDWPVTDADLPAAERAMRALGQNPLFMIRPGEDKLDALLEAHRYSVIDPVNLYAMPVAELLAGPAIAPGTVFTMWPPLELAREIWAEGGVGPERVAVMERATTPKAAILVRVGDHPGGVGYVALHDGIAMVHALHVVPEQRRRGAATIMLRAAAKWAAENGADVLSLNVTQGNHAANPLYATLGMRLVGHYHYRVLDQEG